MKCITPTKEAIEKADANPNEVIRVTNEKAKRAVDSGYYKYVSKAEWKEAGRH